MFGLRKRVYFDSNATTSVSKKVRKKICSVLKHCYGNPSSLYHAAFDANTILLDSRKLIADAINAKEEEIIFTGSATESNNMVLKSLTGHFFPNKKKIVSTPLEHPSIINTLEYLNGEFGVETEFIPVDKYGFINSEELDKMIDDDTFLVICMFVNNETGTIQNMKAISEITRKHGTLLMADAVQALGKIPLDMAELGVDYASFSAHKIHGPKGSGALYVRKGNPIGSFIHGGHQEGGLRAGTESLHNIAGFGEAVRSVPKLIKKYKKLGKLKNSLIEGLKKIRPDIIVNSPEKNVLLNTASITFPGTDNNVFMGMLNLYGIAVSTGSACSTPENKPSHVLTAIGLSEKEARETIRFSLSESTTEKDVSYVLRIIDNYFSGKSAPIGMISPGQLNEELLFHEELFILDVRFEYERPSVKSLPGAHEIHFFSFRKQIHRVPKDKNIIVICQSGMNSPLVAYYMRAKGYKRVSFLMTGMIGWKFVYPELYKRYGGVDVRKI